jgi:hypothetical protein
MMKAPVCSRLRGEETDRMNRRVLGSIAREANLKGLDATFRFIDKTVGTVH